ncbi:outer membrane protein [Methylosinus sp. Sm6]|uniref:outer membrane protein n=1 Tax=Methylosinus sp. Sm6 TaxID=2866948 RepID=UPI001C996B27|nr:outer membrane beta-barrel protein [Methylosinus sp. Sm6]MBY6239870.1 outer membrane beta-barrel protein [Methylosinus sp. Sm6]
MRKSLLSALIASMLAAGAADAADLPRRSAPMEDYYSPAPAFSWQGFYLGVNAGYGFSAFQKGSDGALGEPDGWLAGVTGGFNYTFGPNFLVGLEADFDFSGGKSSRSPVAGVFGSSGVDNIMTVRPRAGVTFDRALVFLTGGFAGVVANATLGNAFTGFYAQQSKFLPGWALGAGIEYGLAPNLSAKAEYLFTSVESERYFEFTPNALHSTLDTSLIRGGFNYHF